MNAVWLVLIISGCVVALLAGNVDVLMSSVLEGAYDAVELVIGLAGIFCLWVGIERLANESGLIDALARVSKPVLGLLFPYVKDEDKIMGAISATIISNILGLSSQTLTKPWLKSSRSTVRRIRTPFNDLGGYQRGRFVYSPVIALRAALGSIRMAGPTAASGSYLPCRAISPSCYQNVQVQTLNGVEA